LSSYNIRTCPFRLDIQPALFFKSGRDYVVTVVKAAFQHLVEWCTQPSPAIFERRVGAYLHVWSKDDPYPNQFQGTLRYRTAGTGVPPRFDGILSSFNEQWTLDIKLFDLVEVSLLFPSGILSQYQIDQVANPGAFNELEFTFQDDTNAYTLDLLDQTVI
jgi:hypothetical protein